MPQNDEFQATYIQSVHNTRITNVFTYQQTSGDGTGSARLALATAFFASPIITNFVAVCGAAWGDLCLEVRQLDLPGQDFFRVLSAPSVGAGDTLNPATAAQLALFPSTGGPGQQGSVYVAGIQSALEDENNLTNAAYLLMVALAESMIPPLTNSGYTFQMGLPSRPFIPADPGPPPVEEQTALPFRAFVLADARAPLTKIQSRRLNTKC